MMIRKPALVGLGRGARRPTPAAFLAIGLSAMLLDLATKALALRLLPAEGVHLLPVFSLSLGFNSGVSFGLFAGEGNLIWIALFTGTALVLLSIFGVRAGCGTERAGYALIAGGGFANLADRLHDGVVTDFLDLHASGWHFPTFNLADVAITFGALLIVLCALNLSGAPARSRASGRRDAGEGPTPGKGGA